MNYALIRNGKVVQHIIMTGPEKSNFKTPIVLDLKFETYKAANEVAEVLNAEISELNVDNLDKAA